MGTKKIQNSNGFTLIELLVVISIIGFLSSVVFVMMNSVRIKAKDARILADVHSIIIAVTLYNENTGNYLIGEDDAPGYGEDYIAYGSSFLPGLVNAGLISPIIDPYQDEAGWMGSYLWIWKVNQVNNINKRFVSCGNTPEAQAVLLFGQWGEPSSSYPIGYAGLNAVCFY